jgi:hypothetical protein
VREGYAFSESAKRKDGLIKWKRVKVCSSRYKEAFGEMKQSGWLLLLFREAAAVAVAVHEGKYRRKTVFLRPLQAPEKPISTAD